MKKDKRPLPERQMENLQKYVKRMADSIGWKSTIAMIAHVQKKHFHNSYRISDFVSEEPRDFFEAQKIREDANAFIRDFKRTAKDHKRHLANQVK